MLAERIVGLMALTDIRNGVKPKSSSQSTLTLVFKNDIASRRVEITTQNTAKVIAYNGKMSGTQFKNYNHSFFTSGRCPKISRPHIYSFADKATCLNSGWATSPKTVGLPPVLGLRTMDGGCMWRPQPKGVSNTKSVGVILNCNRSTGQAHMALYSDSQCKYVNCPISYQDCHMLSVSSSRGPSIRTSMSTCFT